MKLKRIEIKGWRGEEGGRFEGDLLTLWEARIKRDKLVVVLEQPDGEEEGRAVIYLDKDGADALHTFLVEYLTR